MLPTVAGRAVRRWRNAPRPDVQNLSVTLLSFARALVALVISTMKQRYLLLMFAVLSLPFSMAHGGGGCGGDDDDEIFGPPTQSVCPSGSTLTYENFGKPFMEQYCTRCHSSQLSGAERNGATKYHDFDSVAGVRPVADHIDQTAAFGPAANNMVMPPNGPFPTAEERTKLGEWLQCGAP
jgi:hypothetical protein